MNSSGRLSRASSSASNSDLLSTWPYDRLVELVATTLRANEVLKAETEMFNIYYKSIESQLKRAESSGKNYQSGSVSAVNSVSSQSFDGAYSQRTPRFTRQHTRSGIHAHFERLLKLKAEDKCDIALKESERFKSLMKQNTKENEKIVDNYKAHLEELHARMQDLRKERYEFERDVLNLRVHNRNGNEAGEKVTRYFDDKMRSKDAYVSKIRLKNQVLHQQHKKLYLLLKQKEEIGDILTEIDFQQLKIENAEHLEKIDERNKDFFRLKNNNTVTMHVLNKYKKNLHAILLESAQLNQDIQSRTAMLGRLESETKYVESERQKAETNNKKLRQYLAHYKVPEVMDAVRLKGDLVVLATKVNSWERKLKIAEMAYSAQKRKWSNLKMQVTEGRSVTGVIN